MMICIISSSSSTYAYSMVPNTIRVGLRSAYRDKASIAIKNTEIEVGYEDNDRFVPQGTLISNTGFIVKPSQKQYYNPGERFYTYNEAAYSALIYQEQGINSIVAYNGPGQWEVYLTTNGTGMGQVINNGTEIIVQDGKGKDLIVCQDNGLAPVFAGKSEAESFDLTQLANGTYRGWFEFKRSAGTITAINIVDYEDYLYGVIAAEMPASWHMEALKAQAVAARSMSIHQINKYIKDGYNVCDTINTQVYKGFTNEYPRTNQAVDETRGMVATYNGRVAETLFYSTSGGYTEDPQYVWGNPIPYLKSIPDPYEIEPEGKPWTRTITLAEIDRCLANQKISIGKAQGLKINSYTPAGRVIELEIIGTKGTHKITRENIRNFFSATNGGPLRSRMFRISNAITSPTPNQNQGQTLENLFIYRGDSPKYLMGANGKIVPIGESLIVQGASGQASYGETKINNNNSNGAQLAYGDVIISGEGYGHGVGMSQSGANGMAKAGYTYDQIIEYYYQDVRVQR